jgi:hypothetical protein
MRSTCFDRLIWLLLSEFVLVDGDPVQAAGFLLFKLNCLGRSCIKPYALLIHPVRDVGQHRSESLPVSRYRPQLNHQPEEGSLHGVMVAVTDTDSPRVAPDFGGQK